jgi:ATP-dependent RNA helicase RhlE
MFDFEMLDLPAHLKTRLKELNFSEPTPIQNKAIPLALAGHDILGLAQTGTGKTLAFGLPLLNHVLNAPGKPEPKVAKSLILAPTRELVNQIAESLKQFTIGTKVRVMTVVGGQSINKQIQLLGRGTDILVATPGRLIDLLDRRAVTLKQAHYLVLDEADQMLDLGFIHALRRIAPELGTPRQTMLFSATMPKKMEELSSAYLKNPQRVQVSPPGKAADKITQSVHFLAKASKPGQLRDILRQDPKAKTLVFGRTKHGTEKLMKSLVADGFRAVSIHGNKSQGQRDRAIAAFKAGDANILCATDVAARGIDIPDVMFVVNYDLPEVADNYVHRIGRTARAGRTGEAITLCSPEEIPLLRDIEKVMKIQVPVASGEGMLAGFEPPAGAKKPAGRKRPHRGGRPSGGASAPGGNTDFRKRRKSGGQKKSA